MPKCCEAARRAWTGGGQGAAVRSAFLPNPTAGGGNPSGGSKSWGVKLRPPGRRGLWAPGYHPNSEGPLAVNAIRSFSNFIF